MKYFRWKENFITWLTVFENIMRRRFWLFRNKWIKIKRNSGVAKLIIFYWLIPCQLIALFSPNSLLNFYIPLFIYFYCNLYLNTRRCPLIYLHSLYLQIFILFLLFSPNSVQTTAPTSPLSYLLCTSCLFAPFFV